ncbi:hypothetical protein DB88DRAFT_471618 [Papiliotrema laurentii]|uniref:Uncharacterized protein n=1 Tax=Papiliotrema laurentii TaxID=5418 RepID=A0AAD9FSX9_PAPLA|nr:hypothetical protein DB88DRAFT_471618 [Papiliotrema laurentii]
MTALGPRYIFGVWRPTSRALCLCASQALVLSPGFAAQIVSSIDRERTGGIASTFIGPNLIRMFSSASEIVASKLPFCETASRVFEVIRSRQSCANVLQSKTVRTSAQCHFSRLAYKKAGRLHGHETIFMLRSESPLESPRVPYTC